MESPKPVPPYFLCVEPSACWKASKTIRSFSFAIPIPVSVTLKLIFSFASSVETLSVMLPFEVNLIALDNKFFKTCSNRSLSVFKIEVVSGSISIFNSRFFAFAIGLNNIRISEVISSKGTSSISNVILPDSILERSKISSMSVNNPCPELCITSAYSTYCPSRSSLSVINLERSKIEFKGVRNSWDMFARNSDLYFVLCSSSLDFC